MTQFHLYKSRNNANSINFYLLLNCCIYQVTPAAAASTGSSQNYPNYPKTKDINWVMNGVRIIYEWTLISLLYPSLIVVCNVHHYHPVNKKTQVGGGGEGGVVDPKEEGVIHGRATPYATLHLNRPFLNF